MENTLINKISLVTFGNDDVENSFIRCLKCSSLKDISVNIYPNLNKLTTLSQESDEAVFIYVEELDENMKKIIELISSLFKYIVFIINKDNYIHFFDYCSVNRIYMMEAPVTISSLMSTILSISNSIALNSDIIRTSTKNIQNLQLQRLLDRAKLLLIRNLGMSEEQAHQYITHQAMELRVSKVNIAQQIIKTYHN